MLARTDNLYHLWQVTEPAKKLVSSKFAEAGISIYKEGSLTADVIEKDKLIDNHYYAIANKVGIVQYLTFNCVALAVHHAHPSARRHR